MTVKAIILDFDGTIMNTSSAGNMVRAANTMGLNLPAGYNTNIFFSKEAAEALVRAWSEVDMQKFLDVWEATDINNPPPLIEGAVRTLQFISEIEIPEKIFCGILTQRQRNSLVPLLRHYKIEKFFHPSLIQTSCIWPHRKPDPRSFGYIKTNLFFAGISLYDIIYIGDSLEDMRSAHANGVRFISVETGTMTKTKWLEAGLDETNMMCSIKFLPEWLKENIQLS